MKRGLIVTVLLIVSWTPATAGEGDVRRVRTWGGDQPAEQLAVVNGHAFFGGETIRVADLADPAAPVVVGEVRLDAAATDIDAHGDRVFAVDGGDQLTVIDAGSPQTVRVEGRFPIDGGGWRLRQVAFRGDTGLIAGVRYATGYVTKLFVVDVSETGVEPAVIGSVSVDGAVERLALGERLAVVSTDEDRLIFIDVSEPSAPVVVLDAAASSYVGNARVSDLEARGNVLAIGDTQTKVTALAIPDPDGIRYLGVVTGLDIGVPTVGFDGNLLHVGGGACSPLGVCGGYALVEVPVPGAPKLLARMDGPWLAAPVAHEGVVVAAGHRGGLRVVDPGTGDDPMLLDVMVPAREVGPFASAGRLVHAVDTTSFLDAADPDRNRLAVLEKQPGGALAERGSYSPEGEIWAVAGDNSHVAVAMYDEATEFHTVEVLDVNDPASPVRGSRIGAEISMEHATDEPHLRSYGDRLYFSLADSDEVLIHEVARGWANEEGRWSPAAEMVNFVPLSEDLLVVAVRDGDTGWIDVVDTSDLPGVTVTASYRIPAAEGFPVTLDGDGALVAVLCEFPDSFPGAARLTMLLDVSDPANPVRVGDTYPPGGWVAVGDGLLHGVHTTMPTGGDLQHLVIDLTDAPDWEPFESIGPLDAGRNRVQADGSSFCVSRGRLEIYDYRKIVPVDVVPDEVLPVAD
ncbi:MAG: hypothetical protein V2I67_17785 [Thermoanaerobaculales bacterium]|nr:hypothetical protein [Thermoanaerobaculales bacterium]